jgi:hypothetical protein
MGVFMVQVHGLGGPDRRHVSGRDPLPDVGSGLHAPRVRGPLHVRR